MVNIDTVYQKVLTFANKEQRGYVTPQEFNLFADQAQKEIFEQYFYDLDKLTKMAGSTDEYGDVIDILREKILIFEATSNITSGVIANNNVYRLGTVFNADGVPKILEEVTYYDLIEMRQSPLPNPTMTRPVYARRGNNLVDNPSGTAANCTYTRPPSKPNWSYVVVNNKAMHDPFEKVDFELHPSEENELTYKILKFAGLSMKRDDIAQGGQGLETMQVQQEKQ